MFQAIFDKLKKGLARTRAVFGGLANLFTGRGKVDEQFLDELEKRLYLADVGTTATAEIVIRVRQAFLDKEVSGDVQAFVRQQLRDLLASPDPVKRALSGPTVVLVAGVNGSGKTTTIAKLGHWLKEQDYGVLLAAGDTFRAAAIEQLQIWGERIGAPVIAGKEGGDAAGIVFDGVRQATQTGIDVLIVDTAGRLQNKTHLMDELSKIRRVLGRINPEAPHDVLLVLDATTGQNALAQVEVFRDSAGVTGLIMTKLDGTARGGILVAAAEKFGLPIHAIGVGEGVDDLRPFDPRAVARAIAGLPNE
jgi:fused signal recognition particle receptor